MNQAGQQEQPEKQVIVELKSGVKCEGIMGSIDKVNKKMQLRKVKRYGVKTEEEVAVPIEEFELLEINKDEIKEVKLIQFEEKVEKPQTTNVNAIPEDKNPIKAQQTQAKTKNYDKNESFFDTLDPLTHPQAREESRNYNNKNKETFDLPNEPEHNQGNRGRGGRGRGGRGRGRGGYNQGNYNENYNNGYNQNYNYNQGPYNQNYNYHQGGYNQGGNNQGGYNQGGYNQGGYNQGGYNQGGYNQGGYNQIQNQGFNKGYNQNFNQAYNQPQGNFNQGYNNYHHSRGRGRGGRGRGYNYNNRGAFQKGDNYHPQQQSQVPSEQAQFQAQAEVTEVKKEVSVVEKSIYDETK